jgi:hypothetical protein
MKPIVERAEKFFYGVGKKEALVPISFISCLNALCFLSRRKFCLGKDPEKAFKIVKWLWIEEKLGDMIMNPARLVGILKEYPTRVQNGACAF